MVLTDSKQSPLMEIKYTLALNQNTKEMVSYLVWGKIDSKSLEVVINEKDIQTIKLQFS